MRRIGIRILKNRNNAATNKTAEDRLSKKLFSAIGIKIAKKLVRFAKYFEKNIYEKNSNIIKIKTLTSTIFFLKNPSFGWFW